MVAGQLATSLLHPSSRALAKVHSAVQQGVGLLAHQGVLAEVLEGLLDQVAPLAAIGLFLALAAHACNMLLAQLAADAGLLLAPLAAHAGVLLAPLAAAAALVLLAAAQALLWLGSFSNDNAATSPVSNGRRCG